MIPSTLFDIATWSGGALIAGVPSEKMSRISTDTRTIGAGDAFLALIGETFNGHEFVADAIRNGAKTLILSELTMETEYVRGGFTGNVIHVRNTLKALQEIALHYRRQVIPNVFVTGVTGSNGKTSTKDFLNAVLSQAGEVNATQGNLNNHIGLPLTVLDTEARHALGVWEMGMNHPGEIAPLAEIAAPDCAVITNIGSAHIEFLKTREAIADEKACLPRAVPRSGFCVMPENDDFFARVKEQVACEMIGIGGESSPVRAENVVVGTDGVSFGLVIEGRVAPVNLPAPGRHMVTNALLAATVGHRRGMGLEQIAAGLTGARLTLGRLEKDQWNGVAILNDSYNANPDSMKAALSSLVDAPGNGRKIAALGFMGELGDIEQAAHREVGEFAAGLGIDLLVTVSPRAAVMAEGCGNQIMVEKFENHEAAATYLKEVLRTGDTLLVKGSRSAAMEKVIQNLKKN